MTEQDFYDTDGLDEGPLAGVRVLDVSAYGPGPLCGQVLADLGADVIKIDLPGSGDPARDIPPFVSPDKAQRKEASIWHLTFNRGKRGITLDIRQPEGQALFKRLTAKVDVVIESFTPGTLEGWNLGYATLKAVNPGVILVSISAFGQFGPWSSRKGFDPMAQAVAGMMQVTGERDGRPLRSGNATVDHMCAWHGAMGAMAALWHRSETGEGQWVDAALADVTLYSSDLHLMGAANAGYEARRMGNATDTGTPFNTYRSADGHWVFINAAIDPHWKRLCELMGRQDLAGMSYGERCQRFDEVDGLAAAWAAQRSAKDILGALDGAGITCGPVATFDEILAEPHYRARGTVTQMQDPDFGPLTTYGPCPKFSVSRTRIRSSAPRMGQHNAEVYGDLGLNPAALDTLKAAGVV
ncbi:MAG: CaiB/BaiF CoA transferase family protein [Pseudomonadota bacterium]